VGGRGVGKGWERLEGAEVKGKKKYYKAEGEK
jgi:hypothetical protein